MKKKLSFQETVFVASTLFGMFFGAGNLIFPVHLGQLAGSQVWPATLGFIVTAVGIPILGVAALGLTHSDDLLTLSGKVSRWYAYVLTCALYLTIGPFFAIPRCATTSFVAGISPLLGSASGALAQLIFTAVFFAAVLFFSLRPNEIMTWVGKVINPIFLVFLGILIVAAMLRPGASITTVEPAEAYRSAAFFNGFVEGYGTMDAIAALAFGVVVVNVIRGLGVTDNAGIARSTVRSGVYAGVLMALIYVLTIVMGAQSRGLFETSENGGVALAQISGHYLGTAGSAILALTIVFACLKTAIGLVTSCGEIFVKMFPRSLGYRAWVVVFTLFSFGIANVGLTALINYSIPVLMLVYPLVIVLVVLALTEHLFGGSRTVYAWVTAGAFLAAIFDFFKTLPEGLRAALHLDPLVAAAAKIFPLFNLGFGWLVPSLIGLVIGLVLSKHRKAA
ncbi:MAG: branched-chain amino acid transport system II carrier protein [Oscillospiraceae bacterium]|nr:branched-chain amino acid transport system II carrier protein [Oscillospiraceae bacterium]